MGGLCVANKHIGVTLELTMSFRSFVPIETYVLLVTRVSKEEGKYDLEEELQTKQKKQKKKEIERETIENIY